MFPNISDDILKLLDETYPLQRQFINNPNTTIQDINKEWPYLFLEDIIYWHYNKLMPYNNKRFEDMFSSKMNKILQFGKNKKYIEYLNNNCKIFGGRHTCSHCRC